MFVKSKENYFLQYNDFCIILTASIVNVDSLSTRALSSAERKQLLKLQSLMVLLNLVGLSS